MLALVVEFRIHAPWVDAFAAATTANAQASLQTEPGCRQFDVCRDPTDPALFFLYELCDDEGAIAAHLASPQFRSMDAATPDWAPGKSVRRLVRVKP